MVGLPVFCSTSSITLMPRCTLTGSIPVGPNGGRRSYASTVGRSQVTRGCPVKMPTHLVTTKNMTNKRSIRHSPSVEVLREHFVHLLFEGRRQGMGVVG